MHQYPHHIGDFRGGTVNMTRLERWIYRDLLDVYYDKEQPLSLDVAELCRDIGARTDEEKAIVADLLGYKFVETEDGYVHERCEEVLAEYRAKADTARENGKKGGRPPKANGNPKKPSGFSEKPNGNPEETGSQANHKPITNNHKPKEEKALGPQSPAPDATQHVASPAERSVEIAVYLRKRGIVGANSTNPNISAWGDDVRVTNEVLDAALSVVAGRKMDRMPGPNYLQPIIAQLLNPPPARASPRTFHDERAETIAALTGRSNNHERPEHDDRIIDV